MKNEDRAAGAVATASEKPVHPEIASVIPVSFERRFFTYFPKNALLVAFQEVREVGGSTGRVDRKEEAGPAGEFMGEILSFDVVTVCRILRPCAEMHSKRETNQAIRTGLCLLFRNMLPEPADLTSNYSPLKVAERTVRTWEMHMFFY